MAGINSFIFIYGPPASGKSSVGCALAERLRLPFVDLDTAIEQRAGRTIPQIFAEDGEPGFRVLENEMLQEVLAGEPSVVALGGGTLLDEANRAACRKNGVVVCLQVDDAKLLARAEKAADQRPLVAGRVREKMAQLLEARRQHYAGFSTRLDVNKLSVKKAVAKICILLGRFTIEDPNRGTSYPVLVGDGLLAGLPALVESCRTDGRLALVSDSNVAPLYLDAVQTSLEAHGFKVTPFIVPAGEGSKSLATLQTLWDGFLAAGLGRKSMVLALGGGVVTDLTGYAAASFMRGIFWGALPTSVLGMVDASLGGKTGINLPAGKNLVGAFYPPRFVLADVSTLQTLPEREWRGGLAEVVKHGVIADISLFEICGQGLEHIQQNSAAVISQAVAVKVDVVNRDPFEGGLRACLNLGHTIGHAVESLSDYALSHGEAVSIGTVAEARIAEKLGLAKPGLADEILSVLAALGLPFEIPLEIDKNAIYQTLQLDKKRAAGKVKFALPVEVGRVEIGVVVDGLEKILQTL